MQRILLGQNGIVAQRAGSVPLTKFQVMGERGSGTNFVRKTLEKNLSVTRIESLGWKHGFPSMVAVPSDVLVICVVRHAWDWAKSLYARPWHAHPDIQALDFDAFIRSEWRTIVDRVADFETLHPELDALGKALQLDRHPITGLPFRTVFELRRTKLAALLGMANRNCNCLFMRFETFSQNPEAVTRSIAKTFGFASKSEVFDPVFRRMGNRFHPSVPDRAPTPKGLSDANLAHLRACLDLDQEAALGYLYS